MEPKILLRGHKNRLVKVPKQTIDLNLGLMCYTGFGK